MASGSDREPMDVTFSEGNLYDQNSDRKRFKPLRAIRKMFRGKKKSKEFSKSTGSLYTPGIESDGLRPTSSFVRSLSHESVFTPEGILPGPEDGSLRHALSADNVGMVTVPINQLKKLDEPDAAKSMSIGSDVNKSTNDVKKEAPEINLDLDMNDLPVSVPRLNNKAAYDKIALRPKRRAAARSRGAQQKHVIRVEAQVNGFPDSSALEDEKEEIGRDISPPVAKKPRPPSFLLPPPDVEKKNDEDETTAVPKRRSMLGRSPMGSGPAMIVPTLEDMQKVKLRKRQTDGDAKATEKPVANTSSEKSKSLEQPKTDKTKSSKKSSSSDKKANKQEQKSNSEGGSSIFPWKNKSTTPKSPPVSPKVRQDSQKENEKPKSSPKFTKKNITKGSSTSKLVSSDKKESSKKKPFGLGKRDKNHSGNNSKVKGECTSVNAEKMEVSQLVAEKESEKATKVLETEKMEISDTKEKNIDSPEEKSEPKQDVRSKYAEKLKLEAEKLAEKRVDQEHPKSPVDVKNTIFGETIKPKIPEHGKPPILDKPTSPKSPLDEKTSVFGESIKLKATMEKDKTTTNVVGTTVVVEKTPEVVKKAPEIVEKCSTKGQKPTSPVKKSFSPVISPSEVETKSILKRTKSQENKSEVADSTIKPVVSPIQSNVEEKPASEKEISPESNSSTVQTDETKAQISEKITLTTRKKASPVFPRAGTDNKHAAFAAAKSVFGERKARANTEPSMTERKDTTKSTSEKGVTFSPTSPTKSPSSEESGELYSRNKLKSIGYKSGTEKFGAKKSESFKNSSPSVTSPARALRARSFNIGTGAPLNVQIISQPTSKSEEAGKKDAAPTPTKDKPILASKPSKTPDATPNETTKTLIQDAENNNIKPSDKIEEPKIYEKKSDVEPAKPVLRRNTTKTKTSQDKNDDGVPSWIQMARRRSKVWEDGNMKTPVKTSSETTEKELSEKEVDRPKSLTITTKPSVNKAEPKDIAIKPTPRERKTPSVTPSSTSSIRGTLNQKDRSVVSTKSTETTTPTLTLPKPIIVTKEKTDSVKSPGQTSPTSGPTNRTAQIPNIHMVSPRHVIGAKKDVDPPGQPSWLAIAMRKQKTWAKEETV